MPLRLLISANRPSNWKALMIIPCQPRLTSFIQLLECRIKAYYGFKIILASPLPKLNRANDHEVRVAHYYSIRLISRERGKNLWEISTYLPSPTRKARRCSSSRSRPSSPTAPLQPRKPAGHPLSSPAHPAACQIAQPVSY